MNIDVFSIRHCEVLMYADNSAVANRQEATKLSSITYLTTDELSSRIKYDARTIRERLKDSVLLEGVHYIRPFGGRKILYIWEQIEADMARSVASSFAIPMANGGVCHG
jgi:hypothetical protein